LNEIQKLKKLQDQFTTFRQYPQSKQNIQLVIFSFSSCEVDALNLELPPGFEPEENPKSKRNPRKIIRSRTTTEIELFSEEKKAKEKEEKEKYKGIRLRNIFSEVQLQRIKNSLANECPNLKVAFTSHQFWTMAIMQSFSSCKPHSCTTTHNNLHTQYSIILIRIS
jgi:hypothetical protein